MRYRSLSSLGCLLVLLSLAVGPFAQQVIRIDSRIVQQAEGAASIPICGSNYTDWLPSRYPGLNLAGLSTTGAIYSGLFNTTSQSLISPQCTSGNCTFNAYQSLGFCGMCRDVSYKITSHEGAKGPPVPESECENYGSRTYEDGSSDDGVGCTYKVNNESLPTANWSASGAGDRFSIYPYKSAWLHPDMANMTYPVAGFTSISGPGRFKGGAMSAAQCGLYFCVKKYEAEVTSNHFIETVSEIPTVTDTGNGLAWLLENGTITPERCFKNGTEKLPPFTEGDGCTYGILGYTGLAIGNTLGDPGQIMSGYVKQASMGPDWTTPVSFALGVNTTANQNDTERQAEIWNNVAIAMTNNIRVDPKVCGGNDLAVNNEPGIAWVAEPYISVRWEWIILPAVVVGGAIIFFFAIVLKARRHHIWKSSSLGLFFAAMKQSPGHDPVFQPIAKTNADLWDMKGEAQRIRVQLTSSGTWKVVTHT